MNAKKIRAAERLKCAEELRSLAASHRACAIDNDVSEEVTAIHKAKAETIEYCARRLLDWGE